jgi:hypothetical protein
MTTREHAEDRLTTLQSLRKEAQNLRMSLESAVSCGLFDADELKTEAAGIDDVVSDLTGQIKDAEDAVYAEQIGRKPRARFAAE